MYEEGRGVTPNLPQARMLYGLACDGGDAQSCAHLIQPTQPTEEPPRAPARLPAITQADKDREARDAKGCEAGRAHGCSSRGMHHTYDTLRSKDLGQAVQLDRLGCDAGSFEACMSLGHAR
jgi:uncharacterized protein